LYFSQVSRLKNKLKNELVGIAFLLSLRRQTDTPCPQINQQSVVQGNYRFLTAFREKTGKFDQIVAFRSNLEQICVFFEHSDGQKTKNVVRQLVNVVRQLVNVV
jgi:hypothetical protein